MKTETYIRFLLERNLHIKNRTHQLTIEQDRLAIELKRIEYEIDDLNKESYELIKELERVNRYRELEDKDD